MAALHQSHQLIVSSRYMAVHPVNQTHAQRHLLIDPLEKSEAERLWHAPTTSHFNGQHLVKASQAVADYARIESGWFMKICTDIQISKRLTIRVMGLLGLGSLEHVFEKHRPAEWIQVELFRTRHAAVLRSLNTNDQGLLYTFACDPAFTHHLGANQPSRRVDNIAAKSDVEVLRHCGIAAFPFGFQPGQKGDVYQTQAVGHPLSKAGARLDSIPTIFLDPSCPAYLLQQDFLASLTFLDLPCLPYEQIIDLVLWAALHHKLEHLICLLPQFGLELRAALKLRYSPYRYTEQEGVIVDEALASANTKSDCPDPEGVDEWRATGMDRALYWWNAGSLGPITKLCHTYAQQHVGATPWINQWRVNRQNLMTARRT